MNLVDVHGHPILRENPLPDLHAGWVRATSLTRQAAATGDLAALDQHRSLIRTSARLAYMLNPVLAGAVDVLHGLVLGSGASYGVMDDKRAQAAMEEFWAVNAWDEKLSRWFTEYVVDGENLTRFSKAGVGVGRVGFVDVNDPLELTTEDGMPDHVTSIRLNRDQTLAEGEFLWTAHDALWNDPRGWPVIMRAVGPALAYVKFVDARVRLHELQSRINAVYRAFAYGEKKAEELQKKADLYARIPNDGHVLTLHKDHVTGQGEEFEFLNTSVSAADSQADARAILRMMGLALNLPDHYLGIGDTGNRATTKSMSEPTLRSVARRQGTVRSYNNRVLQLELVRRHGADQTYLVKRVSARDGGLTRSVKRVRVKANLLEFPIALPTLQGEELDALVKKVEAAVKHRLASRQTLSAELGYDYALELENMTAEDAPAPASPPAETPDEKEPGDEVPE